MPFRQFVMKVHSRCDLACDHCYVYEHADQSWRTRPRVMTAATAAQAAARIGEHVKRHDLAGIRIVLHGGEPLLAGRDGLDAIISTLRTDLDGLCDVEFRVHTNGLRMDAAFCELFRRHDVKVGVSLDGDRAGNDRHRRFADGRGSHDQVVAAVDLIRREIPGLFAGLLCTIDVRNDPIACYEALIGHAPPAIDFLLPHATWDAPPHRPADRAYARWLIEIFDRWQADGMPVPVRVFDSIIRTTHGAESLTEAFGLEPSDLVVIETDGALEQADSLKTSYDGAPATGFDLFRNSLDEVARHPGILARQSGLDGLCATCRDCPVVASCGGGLFAHRYRTGSGFDNPSVYCDDLLPLIEHVRQRTRRPALTLPAAVLDELAAGYGGPDAIGHLDAGQQTLRRAFLSSVGHDSGAAWDVLALVDRTDPGALDAVLAHPYVRVWAVECLRGRADAGQLAAVAAAAAVRAGVETTLTVPVHDGIVHLPTLGGWAVDGVESVPVEVGGGLCRLPDGASPLPARRLTADGIEVALEDTDPFRDCHQWPAAPRLGDEEFERWQRTFAWAWELVRRDHPAYAAGLAAGLSTIVPLAPAGAGHDVSSTAREAYGSVAIALPEDPEVLALLLIHEFQHVKLGAVLDLFDLYDRSESRLFHAPWREDPRPLEGLLQGAYAHVAVVDYWRARRLLPTGAEAAGARFARWRADTAGAIRTLQDSGALTELGERFVAGMSATVTPWLDEPESVPGHPR
ncbi:FxsB family cyclophane-forming radical SAM/SPASM peptide maturase [Actinomadura sp. DC4]|uniref:FxsB family cyclophane-forming radical SAM/SPASM peptide maturase n=1 Tax=Actinomadura sp. DC4 TaxID=3055069 RepID=UPI0025B072EE|nr:FxsB family cyclophane-forming radical SAM/SPASM peptide maturase [Actinomadura sp. DC4]MDN3359123.1 FxsB family cyclophane-forming radical SAM/SPASM peptide maturase [Actinomadura sp. DC4]